MAKLAFGQRLVSFSLMLMPPTHWLPVSWVRVLLWLTDRLNGLSRIPLTRVENICIPVTTTRVETISARVYQAHLSASSSVSERPTLVFFHGGGCVIGSVDTHDGFCRHLAQHAQVNVVSVGYRLAPEYPFPTAILDAIEAWNWLQDHGPHLGLNTDHMGVAGDSAGGYLALLMSLQSIQQDLAVQVTRKPDFQALLFPMLDLRCERTSYSLCQKGFLLTQALMRYFRDRYLNSPQEQTSVLASPILHQHWSECPPTYLLTVEFDPLCDEGLELAQKLKQAGVALEHEHADDSMHSFISLTRRCRVAKQRSANIFKQIHALAYR